MISMIRLILLALIGLVMFGFGAYHSVGGYPGPDVIDRFRAAGPTIVTVLSFSIGVVAAVVGLLMLALAAYRLRRRQGQIPKPGYRPGHHPPSPAIGPRPTPSYRDEEFEPDDDGFDNDRDDPDYRSHTRNNGRFDRRRYVGGYR